MFPDHADYDFSIEKCPKLIGLNRRLVLKDGLSFEIKLECTLLLECLELYRIKKTLSLETLLDELKIFEKQFHQNENELLLDFWAQTSLCSDVIFEITNLASVLKRVFATDKRFIRYCTTLNAVARSSSAYYRKMFPL
ncbi:unnamed protein product [Rotaria sordida]|uniref:Uncharacterized protein n=1 Tax=Rotaria sordida TaxID=392033 RepID=A0A815AGN9_9BILA|nr:unnamed protein product [Rotaria sordida]CAF1537172.1 unnamed protein product [Rotaria sordida]